MSDYSPCSVCDQQCEDHCILCETCQKWCHFRCENISRPQRKVWDNPTLQYVCIACRTNADAAFDYHKGLHRLQCDAQIGIEQLRTGAEREQMFLKNVNFNTTLHKDFDTQSQDKISNAILTEYYATPKVALYSTGNGDCLFNSFSIHLSGNESRATELRYRCCIEMASNKDRMLRHRLFRTIDDVTPDIDTETQKCASKGNWSSMWHILALSNLLKVKVTVIYPAVNGTRNYYFQHMNQKFRPPFVDPEKEALTIMWTSTTAPAKNGIGKPTTTNWTANHFVPLVTTSQPIQKIQLKPATYESAAQSVNTSHRSPITIGHFVVDTKRKQKKTTKKQKRTRTTKQATDVGRGSSTTSPDVQHTTTQCADPDTIPELDIIETLEVLPMSQISGKSLAYADQQNVISPVLSSGEQHTGSSIKKQKRTRTTKQATDVGNGSSNTLSGVQHADVECADPDTIPELDSIEPLEASPMTQISDKSLAYAEQQKVILPLLSSGVQHTDVECADPDTIPELDSIETLEASPMISGKSLAYTEQQKVILPVLSSGEQHTGPSSTHKDTDAQWNFDLSTILEEPDVMLLQSFITENIDDNTAVNVVDESDNSFNSNDSLEETFVAGPLKSFMDLDELIYIMKGPHIVLDEIPIGRKDGMYYVVDNSANIEKRHEGRRSNFWDDCGAWPKAATPNTIYMYRDAKLTTIKRYKDQYCITKQKKGKAEYIPLEAQPTEEEIVTIRRLYQSLKVNSEGENRFKRRITWLEKTETTMPEIPGAIALVEYVGVFPERSVHGLAKDKDNNAAYIRTKPEIITQLKGSLKHRSVKELERELNQGTSNDFEKHRNEKQLRNTKHYVLNQNKQHNFTSNIADQIICVEEMTKTHPFVQSVKHIQGMKHPVVTLYTEQQIIDIKRFCCRENGVVLGMDKTYNLGELHVTPTVYKDKSVLKRSTKDHPICFGPTFIHQNSTIKAYQAFLHDIADNLTDAEMTRLTVGSVEELAFKSAIRRCFAGCTHVLCTRHLKENTNRHMQNIVGYPESDRVEVVCAIYGKDGLLENTDGDTFSHRLKELIALIEKKDANCGERKFLTYFENKLLPLLTEHVIDPAKRGKICVSWTNNNCESVNHVLKSAAGWKVQDMTKFIETLYTIISNEQEERCRAIRDTGNYRLADRYAHHKTDISYWAAMSEDNRKKRVNRFLSDLGKANIQTVVSTDGMRATQRTPSAGRKPQQVKRKRAERSRTPTAKRKL